VLHRGHPGSGPAAAARDRGDLVRCEPRHKAQRGKHLDVLLIDRSDLTDRLLAGFGEVEVQTELQVLAERQLLARPSGGLAVAGDQSRLHRRGTAADSTLDAVPHHEIEPARVGAYDRLPALDRVMDRARHQGQLFELVAAVGDARRQGVVLALMRERFLVEGLEDDLDLLLEQLAIGFLVQHRGAKVSTSRVW